MSCGIYISKNGIFSLPAHIMLILNYCAQLGAHITYGFQIVFSICMLVILCYKDNNIIDYGHYSTTTVVISAPIFTISIGVIPGGIFH